MHTCPCTCTLTCTFRIKRTAAHIKANDRSLLSWEQIICVSLFYISVFFCEWPKIWHWTSTGLINRAYLAWVWQKEKSFLVFVCFQRGVPQLSWEVPECPEWFGQHPEPFCPSLTPSHPMCTASQSVHIFHWRTQCTAALCLKWDNTKRKWIALH